MSVREEGFGKTYSLGNSLRESNFREDLFLYNLSLGAAVCRGRGDGGGGGSVRVDVHQESVLIPKSETSLRFIFTTEFKSEARYDLRGWLEAEMASDKSNQINQSY